MTQEWHVAMAEAKCAVTHPKWPLSLSNHLLLLHLAGKEKGQSWPGCWIFLLHGLYAYMSGMRKPVHHGSFESHKSFLHSSSPVNSMLQREIENKAARAVLSLFSPWPNIQQRSCYTAAAGKEHWLTQPCIYFRACWRRGRRGIVWWVSSYSNNNWSHQKPPCFQLFIKYTFLLSQIGTIGTTGHQQVKAQHLWHADV